MVFVKQALIVKIIQNLETTISGTIYIELTIAKKNVALFYDELLLNQILNKHIFLTGDLNTDLLNSKCDVSNHFSVFMNTCGLKNLMKSPTCFKSIKGTLTDILLTNKANCFQEQ